MNYYENSYSDKLSQLLPFLCTEIEGEEQISLARAGFESNEISNKKTKVKR